jgi:hypothetical protein
MLLKIEDYKSLNGNLYFQRKWSIYSSLNSSKSENNVYACSYKVKNK